jgi:hypothetical protein
MVKDNQAHYYEQTDFSGHMRSSKARINGPKLKRITINISDQIYKEANELDGYMRMGYQNVLKTAMTIGLTELYHQLSNHKLQKG